MGGAIYLDSSAVLRPVLESGLSPDIERRLAEADTLVTSRLSLVETSRALVRVRQLNELPEDHVSSAERALRNLWRHCEIWELSRQVCDLAEAIAPRSLLRSLDALHLATFVLARQEIETLEMLTADERLARAVSV